MGLPCMVTLLLLCPRAGCSAVGRQQEPFQAEVNTFILSIKGIHRDKQSKQFEAIVTVFISTVKTCTWKVLKLSRLYKWIKWQWVRKSKIMKGNAT